MIECPITQRAVDKMSKRAEDGMRTFGVTMDRAGRSDLEWLRELQEELMDAVVYLEVLISRKEESTS